MRQLRSIPFALVNVSEKLWLQALLYYQLEDLDT